MIFRQWLEALKEKLSKSALSRLAVLGIILGIVIGWGWFAMIHMPGESYSGILPPLTQQQVALRDALQRDVEKLAVDIGERNYSYYQKLEASADFLEASFATSGYKVQRQEYKIGKMPFYNIEVEILGRDRPEEIVVIGAHYDSVVGSPGANDNGTGAAAVLALARAFAGKQTSRSLRFVEFVNEEPPFFQTPQMGSVVYANRSRDRNEKIVAMLSLETIGYYSDTPGSQLYPAPLNTIYPLTGNFIGFVGNTASGELVQDVVGSFRRHAKFPAEGAALPEYLTGVGWSDQWAFWQIGYPGVMVTDTAVFRYPYYHTQNDTPDKIDFDRTAQVVDGLEKVIANLVTYTNPL